MILDPRNIQTFYVIFGLGIIKLWYDSCFLDSSDFDMIPISLYI